MNYTHVRFAYYDTFTANQYRPAPLIALETKYGPQGPGFEVRLRARHFLEVAKHVAGKVRSGPVRDPANARVLTIFLAPEFFLRSSTGTDDGGGHYTPAQVDKARRYIMQLVRQDPQFEDWLLVPGTAVQRNPYGLILSDAFSVARQGGRTLGWRCFKQTFSQVDNLDRAINAFGIDRKSVVTNSQIGRLGGLDIGLEICLDHYNRALKNSVLAANPARGVDIQLVVGCGSSVDAGSVATRTGGYVLRCNGDDLEPPPSREYKVTHWQSGHPAAEVPSISEITNPQERFALPNPLQILPNPRVRDTAGYFGPLRL